MRLFVLVLLAAGTFYPIARQPNLRLFAFGGMIAMYAGAGALLWNEHACHFANEARPAWTLAAIASAPQSITCEAVPAVGQRLWIAASYTRH